MRYVHLVMARKGLFVTVALCTMLAAIVISYVMPKKYEAESIVFIEQNVISDLVKGIAVTPSMEMKIKAIKVTMKSRSMLLNVIKDLDLDLNVQNDQELDGLIAGLQNRIDIVLDERRGVFKISFADTDPVLARDVVNTLTRLYIEENTSTKRKESFEATKFLAEQIDIFKERIDQAEADIDHFKSEAGMMLSSNEGILKREIDEAEDALEEVRIRMNALETSRSVLLNNTPLRKQLDEQRMHLKILLTRYTRNHPAVKHLQSAIAETERQLNSKNRQELSAVYRSSEYQGIKVELASLKNIKENLEAEVSEKKDALKNIPALRTRLLELERKKQNEVIIYEKLVSRYGQSEVSKEMELQDKSMSFRVLDPAVVPSTHSSPNRPLIILLGIVGGIGLGLGIIVLMDLINPSIKSLDDLREFGVPVLAVVPKMHDEALLAKQKVRARRVYAVGLVGIIFCLSFLVMEVFRLGVVDMVISKVSSIVVG